ncbi:MAG: nucleoside 2-deoxyribosyltransferase domain-containing protein, partial [Bacteroidota bacterium]
MSNSTTIYPPATIPAAGPKIFLAGSIEMGQAPDWQQQIIDTLADQNCIWLNPRRRDWDSSWRAEIDNPVFVEQVEWELAGQEQADLIAMYLDPGTKAPISLLELGLFANSGKMIVCCPEGYWRKGNVDVVCRHHGVYQVPTLELLISTLR